MEGRGPGALYKFLMAYDLPKGHLPHPITKALASQRQQTKSFGAEGRFLDWYAKCLRMGTDDACPSGGPGGTSSSGICGGKLGVWVGGHEVRAAQSLSAIRAVTRSLYIYS